ncbi:TRAP transporter substrate-binding protein DctP, partial [Klebsiella pneumoniae]|uniref:TRAP transporter substrate-binding protein DctP n=1 Tax=Klebsiella pneumoniae TaxID=573 RepID=UPI003853088D
RGEYQADAAKEAKLRPLGAIPRMPRQLSCNRVVRAPADMKGLKIRVPETALWRRTFEMFGASPTPLPFPEVFQALKSGVIDGQDRKS